MELDLSKLPDQTDSQPEIDLSKLPDVDLSNLPDNGEQGKSTLQKVDEGARRLLGGGLEAISAPFELAGEAVRQAREGGAYRLPTITRHLGTVDNRYVTNEQQPSDLPTEVLNGLSGIAGLAAGPIQGKDSLQYAKEQVERPKNTMIDEVSKLGILLAMGEQGALGVDKALLKLASPIKAILASGDEKAAASLISKLTNAEKLKYGVTSPEEVASKAAADNAAQEAQAATQQGANEALSQKAPLSLPAPKDTVVEGPVSYVGKVAPQNDFVLNGEAVNRPTESPRGDILPQPKDLKRGESLADYASRKHLEADETNKSILSQMESEPPANTPPTDTPHLPETAVEKTQGTPLTNMSPEAQTRVNYIQQRAEGLKDIPEGQFLLDRNRVNEMAEGTKNGVLNDQLQAANRAEIDMQKRLIDLKLGARQFAAPGSKLSAAIQDLGEGNLTLEDAIKKFGQDKAEKMVEGVRYFRKNYDSLLDEVNQTQAANGWKPYAHRSDYFNHFRELSFLDELKLLHNPDPEEAMKFAKSALTDSKSLLAMQKKYPEVFFGHSHRIEDLPYTSDAVGGFERYARSALHKIHLQPVANEFEATGKALADSHPNLSKYLLNQAEYVSGGADALDKALELKLGRNITNKLYKLTGGLANNVFPLNPSTLGAQSFRIPGMVAENGVFKTAKTLFQQVTNPELRAMALKESTVLQSMELNQITRALSQNKLKTIASKIVPTYAFDRELAMNTWIHNYTKFLQEAPELSAETQKAAVQFADAATAKTQSLLTRANEAPFQRSQFAKLMAPFQKEATVTGNYIWHDLIKKGVSPEQALKVVRYAVSYTAAVTAASLASGHIRPELANFIPYGRLVASIGGPLAPVAETVNQFNHGHIVGALRGAAKVALLTQNVVPGGLAMTKLASSLTSKKRK